MARRKFHDQPASYREVIAAILSRANASDASSLCLDLKCDSHGDQLTFSLAQGAEESQVNLFAMSERTKLGSRKLADLNKALTGEPSPIRETPNVR